MKTIALAKPADQPDPWPDSRPLPWVIDMVEWLRHRGYPLADRQRILTSLLDHGTLLHAVESRWLDAEDYRAGGSHLLRVPARHRLRRPGLALLRSLDAGRPRAARDPSAAGRTAAGLEKLGKIGRLLESAADFWRRSRLSDPARLRTAGQKKSSGYRQSWTRSPRTGPKTITPTEGSAMRTRLERQILGSSRGTEAGPMRQINCPRRLLRARPNVLFPRRAIAEMPAAMPP